MKPLGKIETIMQELVNDREMYNEIFPLFIKLSEQKTKNAYDNLRATLQDKAGARVKSLTLDERSFLVELMFDYCYDQLFIGQGDIFRDLLHNIKPTWHKSINPSPYQQSSITKPHEKEEIKMSSIDSTKAVQDVTYVFGKDSSEMKEEDFYVVIRNLEAEIKSLESIENKPKKLVAKIAELKKSIASIVTLMDSME